MDNKTFIISFCGAVDIQAKDAKEAEQKFSEIALGDTLMDTLLESIQVDEINEYNPK